jgi:hypothetical protein
MSILPFTGFIRSALAVAGFAPLLRAAEPGGVLIDRVWSGHPVSFALLTERGHQFIAYYDAERRLTVAGRRIGDEKWARVQPAGVPAPEDTPDLTDL